MKGIAINEEALKTLVANGLIPSIEKEIKKYREAEKPYLYSTAFSIGELVDTYHKFFHTGNHCEICEKEDKTKNEIT